MITTKDNISDKEEYFRTHFIKLFRDCPIPENEILSNLGLFINRQALTRILFIDSLYREIIDVHGSIIEFGCRWGQNLALFESLRGLYEPYNNTRKIIGFDTFKGFLHKEDRFIANFEVTVNYATYLKKILDYHEQESPLSHIKKYEIIKGDASKKIIEYLTNNRETVIALAFFDMDLYQPTKDCLLAIKDHMPKGSIIAFDEVNVHDFSGETVALKEVFNIQKYKLIRNKYCSRQCYMVI